MNTVCHHILHAKMNYYLRKGTKIKAIGKNTAALLKLNFLKKDGFILKFPWAGKLALNSGHCTYSRQNINIVMLLND